VAAGEGAAIDGGGRVEEGAAIDGGGRVEESPTYPTRYHKYELCIMEKWEKRDNHRVSAYRTDGTNRLK
jgi:hypothetical protein